MARACISLLCLCLVLVSATDDSNATNLVARSVRFGEASQPKQARFFGSFDYVYTDEGYCPPYGCPPWRCQQDSAVIHGYCCGCARPTDNVPFVTCRPDLRCPLSSEPLCTDYNFMLDCCCTGP